MIDLYRRKASSGRACRWQPDTFFHQRRPICFTILIARSRTPDRGLDRETLAVLGGGTTTFAPRAPAGLKKPTESQDASAVFRRGPFPAAHQREARTVDDEMPAFARRPPTALD